VQLEALVRENPPSEFVWVSDAESLSAEGVAGSIWSRGGTGTDESESILGTETSRALAGTGINV
jgi:hypothetical protein